MRMKWACTAAGLVCCLVLGGAMWGQETEITPLSELGPSKIVATDDQGRFFAEFTEPFPLGVSGQLIDPQGKPLAGVEVMVVLEPRPGIPNILGIGHIGAVWLEVDGYDPSRIAGCAMITGLQPVLEIGSVALLTSPACVSCSYQFMLTADEEGRIGFRYRHCTDGRWGNWVLFTRWVTKHGSLPAKIDEACTWIVVAVSEARKLSYNFYHSDGEKWVNRGAVAVQIVRQTASPCTHCSYVRVERVDGLHIMYHCDRTGKWVEIGRWQTLELEPEPDPDPWIPVP